jgi:hypothetical protein
VGVFLGALDVHEWDAEPASEYYLISISMEMRGSAYYQGPQGSMPQKYRLQDWCVSIATFFGLNGMKIVRLHLEKKLNGY